LSRATPIGAGGSARGIRQALKVFARFLVPAKGFRWPDLEKSEYRHCDARTAFPAPPEREDRRG
jgi:hypothetical protein